MSVLSQILAVLGSIGNSVQAAVDALFSQVSLLVKGDTVQSSIASYNNKSFVAEQAANSTEVSAISTANLSGQGSQTPFNKPGWSAGFSVEPGQNSRIDFPLGASYPQLVLGSNNWTIECWFKNTTQGGLQTIYAGQGQPGAYYGVFFNFTSEGNGAGNNCYVRSTTGTTHSLLSAETIRAGQWYHMALVRNGNTITNYLNGTQVSSVVLPNGTIIAGGTTSAPSVGGESASNFPAYGLMSNFRLVNGTAVYTSNFTPPTSPLTAIPGTALLLFTQYNILKDMSGNDCPITYTGTISSAAVSPFQVVPEYSKDGNAGSAFFGNAAITEGVYAPRTLAGSLGNDNFTIETWVYLDQFTAGSTGTYIIGNTRPTSPASGMWAITISDIGNIAFSGGNFGSETSGMTATIPLAKSRWTHFAVTRQAGVLRAFVNGAAAGSAADNANYSGPGLMLGNYTNVTVPGLKGLLAGTRIIKGSAIYTSAFTPTLTPPTATPGTAFLLNYTNAALIDSTGNSVVSTVGSLGNPGIAKGFGRNGGDAIRLPGQVGSYLAVNRSLHNRVLPGYTIEAWIRPETVTALQSIVSIKSTADNGGVRFCVNSNGTILFGLNSAGLTFASTETVKAKVWSHVACTVTGTMAAAVFKIYINGILAGTSGNISLNTTSTIWYDTMYIGTSRSATTEAFIGYIDDLRITKSSAPRYVSNFTPPPSLGSSSLNDPLFHETVLQLSADLQTTAAATPSTNTVVIDSSPVNTLFTYTGEQVVQSPFSPFQPYGWSAMLNGTNDYIATTAGPAFAYGTGDFCIEAWINCTNAASDGITGGVIYAQTTSGINYLLLGMTGTNIMFLSDLTGDGTSTQINSSTQITLGKWHHIAVSRQGTSIRMFLDGAIVATRTSAINLSNITYAPTIGAYTGGGLGRFQGKISNLRVSKGDARYTTTFTPSETPLPADANTALLTLNSAYFKDTSSNNFTVTPFSTAQLVAGDAFKNSVIYDPAIHGGSIFFNGTSGHIQTESIQEYNFGTADFTIEFFARPTSFSGTRRLMSGPVSGLMIWPNSTGTWQIGATAGGNIVTSVATTRINDWTHVAFTRIGTLISVYINGVLSNSSAQATIGFTSTSLFIGTDNGTNRYAGYISSLRIVKGTALYTSNFSVPTAPYTATTATNIEDPFINDVKTIQKFEGPNGANGLGGEFGAGFTNNYSISTNQKKFGTSSLFVNGSSGIMYNTASAFGFGDFCVEMWIYPITSGTLRSLYHHDVIQMKLNESDLLTYNINNVAQITGTTVLTTDQWYHVAVSRSSGITRLWLNGVQQGGNYADSTNHVAATNRPFYFLDLSSTSRFTGYVDNLRVSAVARYTVPFTPPTEDFNVVNGGTVLMLQGTNFATVDSTQMNQLGFFGTAAVSSVVKKFGNSSLALNGTTNYVFTNPATSGSVIGLQNFTAEGWFYSSVAWSGSFGLIGSTTSTNGLSFFVSSGVFNVKRQGQTPVALGTAITTTASMVTNRWYHIALTRAGATFTVFVDGVPVNSTTPVAQSFGFSDILIGRDPAAGGFTGYADDIRITLGVARYSTTFVAPTESFPTQ